MRFVLLALVVLSLWGCGTSSYQAYMNAPRYTEITGIADPAFENRGYARILVDAQADNQRIRHALEAAIVSRFKGPWISPYSSLLLFGEEGGQSEENRERALVEHKIEAILVLSDFVEGGDSVHVPGSTRTVERSQSSTEKGRYQDRNRETYATVNTEYIEPHVSWRPWWDFKAALIDKATGKKAWIGQLRVKGDLENEPVCVDVAKQILLELQEKKLMAKR